MRTAPPGTVIVAGPTPATVMDPAFFPPSQANTASVLAPLARDPQTHDQHAKHATPWTETLDGVIADPMTFDARGRLRPVTVQGPARSRLRGCWNVTSGGMRITLGGALYRWL